MLRFLGWTLALLVVVVLVAGLFFGVLNQNAAVIAGDVSAPEQVAPAAEPAPPPPAAAQPARDDVGSYAYTRETAETPAAAPRSGDDAPDPRTQALRDCAINNLWGAPGCPSLNELIGMFSRRGEIAFTSIPDRMRFRRTYVVRAAASRATESDQLTEGAAAANVATASPGADIEVQTAALLPALNMELSGAGFEITPLQSQSEQTLLDDTPAEWSWRVRPIAGGTHDLTLTAWGILRFGEGLSPVQVRTIHHTVTVEVELQDRLAIAGDYMLMRWEAVAGIIGALGAAGGGAWGLLRFLRRRKRT